jgi:hypothetical protein
MPTPADYHAMIRDAARATLAGLAGLPRVVALDDPETDLVGTDLPAVVVACVGPEQDRGEMATNWQDGIGYPVVVMLMGHGTSGGPRAGGLPEMTAFRRAVRVAFHNKRLAGVAEVGWCEVGDMGPLYDKDSPAFAKLQTGLVVTAVGRFPRS